MNIMGKECLSLNAPGGNEEEEKGDDEFELSLELSIGGRYGKSKDSSGSINARDQENSRCGFSCGLVDAVRENGYVDDLQKRREYQALKRQEARKKREMKMKKSRGGGVTINDGEDKLVTLEAQRLQARAKDREIRERDAYSEENIKGKKNEVGDDDELRLSLFTENKKIDVPGQQQTERQCLYPKVQHHLAPPAGNVVAYYPWGHNGGEGNVRRPTVCRSGDYSSMEFDSEHSMFWKNDGSNWKTLSKRSLEQSSSAVSDHQSTSHAGESSSDASSPLRRQAAVSRNTISHQMMERKDDSSSQTQCRVLPENFTKTAATSSSSHHPQLPTSSNDQTPDQPNRALSSNLSASMPRVSTTGNGPNGKTIMGFLYKYTRTDISIMCVCHGRSFTPAEFVEHAGGVGVSNPMRHITMVSLPLG